MFNFWKRQMPITYSYDDVTLIPAYSELNSRSLADPSMGKYRMPIIASCMDTLGTKEMMNCCIENKVPFIIHRMFKTP
jgi:IMP dehydrogenase/GMP reductase